MGLPVLFLFLVSFFSAKEMLQNLRVSVFGGVSAIAI